MTRYYDNEKNEYTGVKPRIFDDENIVRTVSFSEQDTTKEIKRKAIRQTATLAKNAQDCAYLLDMLGLEPRDGVQHDL